MPFRFQNDVCLTRTVEVVRYDYAIWMISNVRLKKEKKSVNFS